MQNKSITLNPEMTTIVNTIKSFNLNDKALECVKQLFVISKHPKSTISEKTEIQGVSFHGIKLTDKTNLRDVEDAMADLFDFVESSDTLQINTDHGREHKLPMLWIGFSGGFSAEQKSAMSDAL